MRTAFITGCSTGIGAATAARFAREGWAVVATMRDTERGAALAALANVTVAELNVTDAKSIAVAVDIATAMGGIDVLVNNAGVGLFGPFETAPWELVEGQLQTNTLGVMRVTRAVLPAMRAAGHGTIVNVTSIGGLTTMPLNAVYHAAKFAVDAFSEALRYELDPLGITVKIVAPGGVSTPFTAATLQTVADVQLGDYQGIVDKVRAAFSGRGGNYSTPDQIANVILAAATDGTDRLRYVAGADAEYLLRLRNENPIEGYIATMADRFGLGPPS